MGLPISLSQHRRRYLYLYLRRWASGLEETPADLKVWFVQPPGRQDVWGGCALDRQDSLCGCEPSRASASFSEKVPPSLGFLQAAPIQLPQPSILDQITSHFSLNPSVAPITLQL